jgi:hypothetical protein
LQGDFSAGGRSEERGLRLCIRYRVILYLVYSIGIYSTLLYRESDKDWGIVLTPLDYVSSIVRLLALSSYCFDHAVNIEAGRRFNKDCACNVFICL